MHVTYGSNKLCLQAHNESLNTCLFFLYLKLKACVTLFKRNRKIVLRLCECRAKLIQHGLNL